MVSSLYVPLQNKSRGPPPSPAGGRQGDIGHVRRRAFHLHMSSVAADHFRLLGARGPDDPPVLAQHKVTSWSTTQCVLGSEIDTVAGTIGVSDDNLDRTRSLLEQQWPSCRRFASETKLRSLVGTLLHSSTIVRVGRFFLRRMLNTVGLPPKPVWGRSKPTIRLGPEFHADVHFWKMLLSGGAQSRVRFTIPLYRFVPQTPALCGLMHVVGHSEGIFASRRQRKVSWARYDLTPAERAGFQQERAESHDDLSSNVLEFCGMVLMAWVFVREEQMRPRHGQDCLLILPLYHKSGPLGLYAALTVSDLFFVFFVEFYGVF